jgi:hypothetical protein
MPIKIDGTNGVLQAYDFQVLTTGFSYTFAAGTQTLIANPAGTLATGTITMPAAPVDGMVITIESTQQITALTIQGNTGQSLVAGAITMRANQPESFIYRLANTTWYPFAGAANTQIISGTAVTASSTSVDFTGIPAWVKRITVMLSGISTTGTSSFLIQLGDSGGVENTGYTATATQGNTTPTISTATSTAGLVLTGTIVAASTYSGQINILQLTANTWLANGTVLNLTAGTMAINSGTKTLSDVLDRVRITTSGGTDTFDAGTINIIYD